MNSKLINDTAEDQLVSTCRTSIGDSLRSVTYFTRSNYDQLYLRGGLDQDADLASYIGIEKNGFQAVQDAYGEESELGEYEYTIRSFENGFLLRVATESEGVFVTTDALTIQQFDKLAKALTSTLENWRE